MRVWTGRRSASRARARSRVVQAAGLPRCERPWLPATVNKAARRFDTTGNSAGDGPHRAPVRRTFPVFTPVSGLESAGFGFSADSVFRRWTSPSGLGTAQTRRRHGPAPKKSGTSTGSAQPDRSRNQGARVPHLRAKRTGADHAAQSEDPEKLPQRRFIVIHMVKHVGRNDGVKRPVG